MILQELNRYYETLVSSGKLEQPGWQTVRVSYALQINEEGELVRVLPLMREEKRGKKKVQVPLTMNVPAQVKRAVGISANFLCDNSSYFLGVDTKGKPERSLKCFAASRELHVGMIGESNELVAKAVSRFFREWRPELALRHPALEPYAADILAGGNLVFAIGDQFAHQDHTCREIWNRYYNSKQEGERMHCLVTGELRPIARLHPNIKGVAGGQSSGTSLVSFNAPAFESFGKDGGQGFNSPVSEQAAFAYTSALNYMIATPGHHIRLGDETITFWAEDGSDSAAKICASIFGEDMGITDHDLYEMLRNLSAGRKIPFEDGMLDPGDRFFILGLSPNAARLSVRFFLQSTLGELASHLNQHHERMRIVRPPSDSKEVLAFWQTLNETVNQKSKDKKPSPALTGAFVRSVLQGLPYPELLYDQVELRIRAERTVTRGKAAIIKAVLLKKAETLKQETIKEMLTVELNEKTNYPPYLLGRLFAVLENIQTAANPGINATIKDRYFNSACATPAVVFPQLIKLSQAHMKKLSTGMAIYFDKQIGELLAKLSEGYPARLNLQDQGIYQLGYYHQKWTRKKEDA